MEVTRHKVLVLRSAPGAPDALAALDLAGALRAAGTPVVLVLVQDAVLCALEASSLPAARLPRALAAEGTGCHYLTSDLLMRGYRPADVVAGCEPLGYAGLVDVSLVGGASVAGAF